MNFDEAVKLYQKNPSRENRRELTRKLRQEMSLYERIYMLSGHCLSQIQKDMIRTGISVWLWS